MDGYLLDTNIVSAYLDPTHHKHSATLAAVEKLTEKEFRYISVVALAEMTTGLEFFEAFGGSNLPGLRQRLVRAREHSLLDVSRHTATAYAELKTAIGKKFMPRAMAKKGGRRRFVEDWVDETTGKSLGIDENDLWMCAQAKERSLIFLSTDNKMIKRVGQADPSIRLQLY
ncbi:hypothetical protein TH25_24405 [Thalassospira profundimaris]|uniref:PIN domain-containing protein n=1 Tax=Thalassospira profundimaris TaxID=502049 RepID=A0A367WJ87_9PROT|nr:PIN domain-containing protein [Thalassospira profundimaris]MBR9780954.1 type II toxin-antitoxin system VapC family toxin [Rhodospirillales bacterium]MBR9815513.1 type II toxin-antitoxin system VapC family toxin [Rhodospirillales bacterium]RCK40580.1 hypothetical protein TH25_24405 [Thalassospira profundimaris]